MSERPVQVQGSTARFVLWLNHETRAYEASSVSPGTDWERIDVIPRSVADNLAEALATVIERAVYGYQDLNAGGVLSSVKRVAGDALAGYEAAYPREETP